ncbi:leucine-rich repeat and immunoglobulin-like domain-containing nogo receptor-interacting protein 3 [Mytilus edulis]|uniref:leucine-rich repeat and immunoglobulin-like domain-containing nogo receptor-interacting protein 3 n=1 Tax=Mytilus edulis TaxID=6550 RepID=UPI0039F10233
MSRYINVFISIFMFTLAYEETIECEYALDSNFTCLCKVVKAAVDIDCTYLDLVAVPSGIPNNTVILELNNNNIQSINTSSFIDLLELKSLNVLQNKLMHIVNGMFSDISSLQVLNLDYNHMTAIEEYAFSGLNNLTELYLSGNKLTIIASTGFLDLHSLQILDLSYNKLSSLSPGLFDQLESLVEL